MKKRMIAGSWVLLVLFSLGNRFPVYVDTGLPPSEEGVRRERVDYWLGGMMGPGQTDVWSRCGYGVARIETRLSAEDVVATALTVALYSPRTVAVTCADGPETPPYDPLAAPLDTIPAIKAFLESWTVYSDEGQPWRVGDDGELAAQGAALQSVLIRDGDTMRDGWVEATIGHADDSGLVLRFQNNENYYLLALRDDASPFPLAWENVKIYKRVDGEWLELWETDIEWRRGESRRVRFQADGSRLSVFLDDALAASVVDERPLPAGGFGVRHYGASSESVSRYTSFVWAGR
jgi:hypothetical protein